MSTDLKAENRVQPSRRTDDSRRAASTPLPLRLFYFAPFDIQVARVDRQGVIGFCEGLHRVGVEVELVAMRIKLADSEVTAENPLSLYRIRDWFPVHIVDAPVHQDSGFLRVAIHRLRIHVARAMQVARRRDPDKQLVFFTKNYSIAFALYLVSRVAREKPILVFESHMPPGNPFQKWVLKRMDRVITNSILLGEEIVAGGFAKERNVFGTHQGINLHLVDESRISMHEARQKLGLPLDRKLVVYTGKIYDGYKEVEYILEAARILKSRGDVDFILVGGREDHNERIRERARAAGLDNVSFPGFVPQIVVQDYQFAADLLIMYYPSDIELNKYRSPGKLFDYMAAGRPIISGDITCVREVLGDDPGALLIPEDSPAELARAIETLLDDPQQAARLAAMALERVRGYTWDARAVRVVDFINEAVRRE